jgi:hypothetical protein
MLHSSGVRTWRSWQKSVGSRETRQRDLIRAGLWKSPGKLGGFLLAARSDHRSNPGMGTKTTFVCDCCLRESDNNFGWARVSVNGASDGRQLTPDDNRDLCEICWSPLQTLMKKVEERNSASKA